MAQKTSRRFEAELKVWNLLSHTVNHAGHLAMPPMQGAFDARRVVEDHRVPRFRKGKIFDLFTDVMPLQRMHGNRRLLEEDDRGC